MKDIVRNEALRIGEILLERSQFFSHVTFDRSVQMRGALTVRTKSGYVDDPQDGKRKPFRSKLDVEVTMSDGDRDIAHGLVSYVGSFVWQEGFDVSEEKAKTELAPAYMYSFCREHLADLARRAGLIIVLPPTRFSEPAENPDTGATSTSPAQN